MKTRVSTLAFATSIATLLAAAPRASAAAGTIKSPGAHPGYTFEAEPHLILSPPGVHGDFAVGPGFRGTFELLHTGFVKTINDSIGLGFGGDLINLRSGQTTVWVPVVMQWNFWFNDKWSVFGEPGVGGYLGHDQLFRPAFYAGGRFAFTDYISLTLRVGYPNVSVGVSFFL